MLDRCHKNQYIVHMPRGSKLPCLAGKDLSSQVDGWNEKRHFPLLLKLTEELIPFNTACESLKLDPEMVARALGRRPTLMKDVKHARSLGLMQAQRSIMAGTKSWQSLARVLESADPVHWLKTTSAGRPAQASTPYAKALAKRGRAKA
jgi:hypothetical protein